MLDACDLTTKLGGRHLGAAPNCHPMMSNIQQIKRCTVCLALSCLCWVGAVAAERAPSDSPRAPAARRPSIIFILADDLGYGDLGCYGQTRIKTPNIDKLAAEGIRFTDFYAGSTVCAPSRCALMTGLHTGHAWVRGNSDLSLRPEDVTVAELLKQAGYHTG